MKKIRNQSFGDISLWKASAIGTVFSMITGLIIMMIMALLVNREMIKEEALNWLVNIIWAISVFVGTLFAQKKSTNAKLLSVGITVLFLVLIVSVNTLLLFDGNFESIGKGVAFMLCGATPSMLLILKKPKKEKIKFKM